MICPSACSPAAFEMFANQIDRIESNDGLVNAAMAIAMHSFDDLDCRDVRGKINQLSRKIANRLGSDESLGKRNLEVRLAHLQEVIFVEEGFVACQHRQASHLLDSFISTVVELKIGTPEVIGLIFKIVADNIGLRVDGVEHGGRFYIRVHDGHGWLLVDLFRQSILLDADVAQGEDRTAISELQPVPHRDWIRRMLFRNMALLNVSGRLEDHAAMEELLALLPVPE